MASIAFNNFNINVEVRSIDGVFQQIFGMAFPTGFWVLLTIENGAGKSETFPRVDDDNKVKIYATYDEALDDISGFLKEHFRE